MLCGKMVIDNNNRFYKMIASIQDNTKQNDQFELDSLPSNILIIYMNIRKRFSLIAIKKEKKENNNHHRCR